MPDDTSEPFLFPAVGRRTVIAGFDGGRIPSDGGIVLLAAAARRLGIADRLAGLIADPRNPLLVTHSVADILRARMLAMPVALRAPTISTPCAPTPASSSPADAGPTAATTCARSRPCRAGRTRPACARWRA